MAFFPFKRSSISNKLAIIVIFSWLVIALLITSFFVGQEIRTFQKSKIADVNGLARVISVNCIASLAFSDVETAAEVLSSLSARPQIEQAVIYTNDAKLFARYSTVDLEDNKQRLPAQFLYNIDIHGDEAYFFESDYLDLYVPITMDEKMLGTLLLRADLQDFSRKLERTAFVVGGIMLGSLFFAWIVFSMLQRYISHPIQEMTEVMRRVRKEKNYSLRIQESFTDELKVLADGFNSMLDHIQERDEQLLEAKKGAEEASRAKSQFLAQMSHEIRTPMNAIIGMTHMALKSSPGEKVHAFLDTVKNSANNLLGILNDILDFSKIEAGQLVLNKQPFLLRSMLESVISTMNMSAVEKGLKLQYVDTIELPPAYLGDDLRLRQILLNLVGNAIKFTNKGTISVMAEVVESSTETEEIALHFSVIDSGIGIAADKLENIFNSFEQVDSSYVRNFGGTGLGLAISKQLTEMMGGEIWVESELGVGSTFHFTVRMQTCDMASIPDQSHADTTLGAVIGLNILIVDDNEVNRDLARMVLENDHYVSTAITGLDALHALLAKPFDVILMDVQMPVMDGVEATRIIRAAEKGKEHNQKLGNTISAQLKEKLSGGHIPIIAMTAHALGSDHELCIQAGMDDYLTKPFQPDQLFTSLRKIGATGNGEVKEGKFHKSVPRKREQASLEQVVAFLHSTMRLNSEQMGKILAISHKSLMTHSGKMRRALAQNELETFANSAHTIKGTLLQCGLSHLAKASQDLYENTLAGISSEQLVEEFEEFMEGLEPLIGHQGLTKKIMQVDEESNSKGKILVFDEDILIHEIAEGMLSHLGYDSEHTTNSEEAVSKYMESFSNGTPYDVVIADVLLQDNVEDKGAAARILEFDPKAQIVVCSGIAHGPVMVNHAKYGRIGKISKPFTQQSLSEILDKLCR